MTIESNWTEGELKKGVVEFKLTSWNAFSDFINEEMLKHSEYVYRGHGDSSWKLEPTLDRTIKTARSKKRATHLDKFKLETRGRRGSNPIEITDENYWWALGQHHGLLTPLLDWTESPFVALYFAVTSALKQKTKNMTVFSFLQNSTDLSNDKIISNDKVKLINNHNPTIKIIRPHSDENSRLVSQRGLFTRGPNNMDLETWVKTLSYNPKDVMVLIKITIPTKDLDTCLSYLNRMNINDSTLFPDLTGASMFCNKHLTIQEY